jgi:hypothetical protein
MTQEELAATLFHSLRDKIMTLPDDVIVYPAHGAGSACGKNMMKETVDTLGNQKRMNYALRADMTREEFIKEVTDGLGAPPAYFPMNVAMNKGGYDHLHDVISKGSKALSPAEFEAAANETEAVILDTRHQSSFVKGFIPQSIFIGIDGGFAPWVGALIRDVKQPILLVADEGRVEEVITRLGRVGFDNTIGYLEWKTYSDSNYVNVCTYNKRFEFRIDFSTLERKPVKVFESKNLSENFKKFISTIEHLFNNESLEISTYKYKEPELLNKLKELKNEK